MNEQIKLIMVFKTDVETKREAALLSEILHQNFPELLVNFDLEDEDHILRTEGTKADSKEIEYLVECFGFSCRFLSFAEPIA
jgi:hypothetical protein